VESQSKKLPALASGSKVVPLTLFNQIDNWNQELRGYLNASANSGEAIRSSSSEGSDLLDYHKITSQDRAKNIVPLFEKWTATNQKLLRSQRVFQNNAVVALKKFTDAGRELTTAQALLKQVKG
jgi:hypothetical protein